MQKICFSKGSGGLGLDQFQAPGFIIDHFKQSDAGRKGKNCSQEFFKVLDYDTLLKQEIGKPISRISYMEVNRLPQTVGVLKHPPRCWAVTNSWPVPEQQLFPLHWGRSSACTSMLKNEQALSTVLAVAGIAFQDSPFHFLNYLKIYVHVLTALVFKHVK